MPVRTARLAAGLSGAGASQKTVYTCPGGVTAIVKDVRLVGRSDPAQPVTLYMVSGPVLVYLVRASLAANATAAAQGFIVLEPGDHLNIDTPVTDHAAYWVSGTELAGVAP